jgi:hypothetical protein
MSEQALVSVGADLSALRRELANIPNMSEKELQKMLIAVERTAQKAEKAAKDAVKNTAKASAAASKEAAKAQDEHNKNIKEGTKGLAEFLGFDVGPLEKLGEASKLTSTALGAATLAAGAALAAVVGLGAGIFAAVSAAMELEEGLQDLAAASIIPPLDPAFEKSLGETRDTMAALNIATDVLVYEIGGTLAPAVTAAVVGLIDLISWTKETYNAFGGLGGIVKIVGSIYLQNLIDFMTLGASTFMKFIGIVGEVASSLGMESLGGALEEASKKALDFKNSIGATVIGAVVDNTAAGLNGMATAASHSAAEYSGLAKKVSDASKELENGSKKTSDATKDLEKLAEEAKKATDKLKDISLRANVDEVDKLTKEYEKQLAEIEELFKVSNDFSAAEEARAAVSIKYNKDLLDIKKAQTEEEKKRASEAAKAKMEADAAIKSLEDLSEKFSVKGIISKGIETIVNGIKNIGSALAEASGASDLLGAITDPSQAIALAANVATAGVEAKKALSEAKKELAAAVVSGDPEAILDAKAGVEEAKKALEAASPKTFIKGLVDGAGELIKGIVSSLPIILQTLIKELPSLIDTIIESIPVIISALAEALPDIVQMLAKAIPELIAVVLESLPVIISGLIKSIPALITGLIQGLPRLIEALIKMAPMIVMEIIKTLIELLFKSIPQMIVAIFEAIVGAFKKAKQVIKDVFREAVTFGKADTKTFGDTPGPVKVGIEGMRARFSPGDIVVAAKTEEGLRSQIGKNNVQAQQEVRAVLDIRDGLVFVDKAMRGNIKRGIGTGTITGKKR